MISGYENVRVSQNSGKQYGVIGGVAKVEVVLCQIYGRCIYETMMLLFFASVEKKASMRSDGKKIAEKSIFVSSITSMTFLPHFAPDFFHHVNYILFITKPQAFGFTRKSSLRFF